jgi:hypothetical protein
MTIPNEAFYNCTSLKSIDLSSVTSIDLWAFVNCEGLTSVDLSSITFINASAFENCIGIITVTMNSSPSWLMNRVFYGCTSLTSIDLSGVDGIGTHTFYGCTSLVSINFGGSYFPDYAFYGCTSLTSFDFNRTSVLGEYAFYECNSLGAVAIPQLYGIDPLMAFDKSMTTIINFKLELGSVVACMKNDGKIELTITNSSSTITGLAAGTVEGKDDGYVFSKISSDVWSFDPQGAKELYLMSKNSGKGAGGGSGDSILGDTFTIVVAAIAILGVIAGVVYFVFIRRP